MGSAPQIMEETETQINEETPLLVTQALAAALPAVVPCSGERCSAVGSRGAAENQGWSITAFLEALQLLSFCLGGSVW